ncbi:MAG: hypothetical protein U0452_06505 [Anaerolineae bacterium]
MATQTLSDNRTVLLDIVRRWDRRGRVQQSLRWVPRAALPGLAVGVMLAVIARFRPFLLPDTIAAITLLLVGAGIGMALAVIWLRSRSPIQSARRFDVLFGLDERVSTALELLDGRIHTQPELAARQLEDARLTAREVRPRDQMPLRAGTTELLALLALSIALVLLLALHNPQSEVVALEVAQTAAEQAAIDDAVDTVRDLTEQVAADPGLNDEERQQLLQVLEDSAQTLNDPNVSPEEAFAEMGEVQAAFQQVSDLMQQRLSENARALQDASEAMRDFTPPGEGTNLSDVERMLAQMEMMRELAEQMSGQPQPDAGAAMQNAGESLSQSGEPNLQQAGNSMQQAGDAMQQGDQSAAQQSMNDAQDALNQAQQQQQGQQQAQQGAQQGAQQAQQAGEQINQAQQGQQEGQQQGMPGDQSQPSQAGEQGQQGPQGSQGQGQQGQEGQTGQQGQNQQNGQGEGQSQGQTGQSQQGASGEQNGGQQQGQGSQAESAQGDQPGSLSGTAVRSEGAGAGDNAGGEAQASESTGPVQANNNPDGLGQSEFESVYSPRRIGGPLGNDQMFLEQGAEESPVVEGEFSENPNGATTVPYNQVFRSYADAASQNLNTGYVPLGLRDVVRNYFTALEPGN